MRTNSAEFNAVMDPHNRATGSGLTSMGFEGHKEQVNDQTKLPLVKITELVRYKFKL